MTVIESQQPAHRVQVQNIDKEVPAWHKTVLLSCQEARDVRPSQHVGSTHEDLSIAILQPNRPRFSRRTARPHQPHRPQYTLRGASLCHPWYHGGSNWRLRHWRRWLQPRKSHRRKRDWKCVGDDTSSAAEDEPTSLCAGCGGSGGWDAADEAAAADGATSSATAEFRLHHDWCL